MAASAIFKPFTQTTLSVIPGTCVYLDDITVSGATMEEHESKLEMVLNRLKTANLRLHRMKCKFGIPEVSFLGHRVEA